MEDMEVDDFLEHYGVMGMRWGQRKRSEDAIASPDKKDFKTREAYREAKEKTRKARSAFRGQEMIKNAGSAKSAKRQIVGRAVVKQLLLGGVDTVGTAVMAKNRNIGIGIKAASGLSSWAAFINDINQYQDVRRANKDKK